MALSSPPSTAATTFETDRLAADASLALCLFAIAPRRLGGVWLKGPAGPERDGWLKALAALLPPAMPRRRVPFGVADDRLLGGLDLAATLSSGTPILQPGILAEADQGLAELAMAERWRTVDAMRLVSPMDTGTVNLEREGLSHALPARFGLLLFDESCGDDEYPPPALTERVALTVSLTEAPLTTMPEASTITAVACARDRLAAVTVDALRVQALCEASLVLGLPSLRRTTFALLTARAHAALVGRDAITDEDVAVAVRLALLPRAEAFPAPPEQAPEEQDQPPRERQEPPQANEDQHSDPQPTPEPEQPRLPDELDIETLAAALPPDVLAKLRDGTRKERRTRRADRGRSGKACANQRSGRSRGARPGDPRRDGRLSLLATLKSAAPWQRLRELEAQRAGQPPRSRGPRIRPSDFHVQKLEQPTTTTIIFLVDASGSQAMHRLGEAKGAVERLLADCYVRRDRVALVTFRHQRADLVLPPTRSLVAAKKRLGRLPGGGGTPLALALDLGLEVAHGAQRNGDRVQLVLLTDGRGNVTRAGVGDPPTAQTEAADAARAIAAAALPVLFIDSSPRPRPEARQLAEQLAADYLPLPRARSDALSSAVRSHGDRAA